MLPTPASGSGRMTTRHGPQSGPANANATAVTAVAAAADVPPLSFISSIMIPLL